MKANGHILFQKNTHGECDIPIKFGFFITTKKQHSVRKYNLYITTQYNVTSVKSHKWANILALWFSLKKKQEVFFRLKAHTTTRQARLTLLICKPVLCSSQFCIPDKLAMADKCFKFFMCLDWGMYSKSCLSGMSSFPCMPTTTTVWVYQLVWYVKAPPPFAVVCVCQILHFHMQIIHCVHGLLKIN